MSSVQRALPRPWTGGGGPVREAAEAALADGAHMITCTDEIPPEG